MSLLAETENVIRKTGHDQGILYTLITIGDGTAEPYSTIYQLVYSLRRWPM